MARTLQRSWIDAYIDYVSVSESPPEYNLWAGISVLSSTLKRKVYTYYRGIKFFPNQYIVLVGPPGIGKGTAINPAISIGEEAKTITTYRDSITAEKVIERLADGALKVSGKGAFATVAEHCATAVALELPVFLSSVSDRKFSTLCALWDQDKFEYDTKNRGTNIIDGVNFSLVGGCTPDFIRFISREKTSAVTGGFSARTIFVYASEKSCLLDEAFGAPVAQQVDLRNALISDLQHISTLEGEVTFSVEARKLWKQKYGEHNKKADFDSDASANFKSRISSHIIKAALAICCASSDSLEISRDHLRRAIEVIENVRDKVDIVFRCVGESPLATAQDRVLDFIQKRGICSRAEILKYNYRHLTDEQLTQILYVLTKIGAVSERVEGSKLIYSDTNLTGGNP